MNLEHLISYLPINADLFVRNWLENHFVTLKITQRRETKLGDYRKLLASNRHQITVNGDLNPYAFFFVFTHEVAHLKTFVQFDSRTINPHGKEWKTIFGHLLIESINIYPEELKPYILYHAKHPKASLGADINVSKFIIADKNPTQTYLEDLEDGTVFSIGKRVFQKESKRKLRYLCLELKSKKKYLISATATVNKL
ncbi:MULTISPECIES: transcription elongation protein SprT [Algoriella]|uniref:transcription elongation protein SprT n=1 Tax=Algoriella TaxID=1762932 RepID=UPI000F64514F|nr:MULTISPECIES: transcription elongation protein SprT [Algoriella]MBO6213180.1 transcription elongation protein SprT [Algoriella sp.]